MAELSPQAQAVLDAAEPCVAPNECPGLEAAIAAALRAAVAIETHNPWGGRIEAVGSMWMRDQILAIADELEEIND